MKALLDFRRKETSYRDDWRDGITRTAQYMGRCVLCGTRTYAFPDGENDPRGPLGDHAAMPMVASEHGMTGPNVPCCFTCQNDTTERYNMALNWAVAVGSWHVAVDQSPHMPAACDSADWDATRRAWGLAEDD